MYGMFLYGIYLFWSIFSHKKRRFSKLVQGHLQGNMNQLQVLDEELEYEKSKGVVVRKLDRRIIGHQVKNCSVLTRNLLSN